MSYDVEYYYRGEYAPEVEEVAELLRIRLDLSRERALNLVLSAIRPEHAGMEKRARIENMIYVAKELHKENQKKSEREFRDKAKREKMSKRVREFYMGRSHVQQPLHREREQLSRGQKKVRIPSSNKPRFGGFDL